MRRRRYPNIRRRGLSRVSGERLAASQAFRSHAYLHRHKGPYVQASEKEGLILRLSSHSEIIEVFCESAPPYGIHSLPAFFPRLSRIAQNSVGVHSSPALAHKNHAKIALLPEQRRKIGTFVARSPSVAFIFLG